MSMEGRLIGNQYVLRRLIDQGTEAEDRHGPPRQAEIWEAEVLEPNGGPRLVAVKLPLEGHRNPLLFERFSREADILQALKGEGIPRCYASDASDGVPYLVTELLHGKNLARRLKENGRFEDVQLAVSYVLQACEALREAHDANIVHRDIKPANLFLDARTGRIKVLDFGKARQPSAGGRSLTTPGTDLFDSNYAAPEQLSGASGAGAASDIWSIGVTLFQLLAGTLPFPAIGGPSAQGYGGQVQAVPLGSLRPDVDPRLAHHVARCLEHEVHLRFPSVDALHRALVPFAPTPPAHADLEFHDAAALVEAVATPRETADQRKRRVTFLLGAGVSLPSPGRGGVPGTEQIVAKILRGLEAAERKTLEGLLEGGKNRYQVAFEFLLRKSGADVTNTTIRNVVLEAYRDEHRQLPRSQLAQEAFCRRCEADLGAWQLPEGIEALGYLVAEEQRRWRFEQAKDIPRFSELHFTTNFDPLLAVSICRQDGKCVSQVLSKDLPIAVPQSSFCSIVHLHGRWSEGNTLHTSLGTPRKELVSSLRERLEESVLVVLGYGGWNDVFTQTLAELAHESDRVDILWTFFSPRPDEIVENNAALLTQLRKLQPRIQFYRGVDSNQFFRDLVLHLGWTRPQAEAEPVPATRRRDGKKLRRWPLAWSARVAPWPTAAVALGMLTVVALLVGARVLVNRSSVPPPPLVAIERLTSADTPRAPDAEIPARYEGAPLAPAAPQTPSPGGTASAPARPPIQRTTKPPARAAFGVLHVSVPAEVRVPELTLWLDGAPLPPTRWNTPLRVQVGTHRIEARATGLKSWLQYGLTIQQGQQPVHVTVPKLTRLGI